MSFFAELGRRNVFRVGTAYLVLAWLVIQVTDTVAPALRLPDWMLTVVVWIGIIGFPFALIFSWAFELTPEGLKREEEVKRDFSITRDTGRRIDRVIIGLLALVVGFLLFDRYYLSGPDEARVDVARSAPQEMDVNAGYSSIAVLPFVNMSNDEEQVYFSDGISEELLNLLASIEGLKVAARTSSFAFRDQEQDIREIASRLNVETILEGSVRKAGSRIRVTAQLISASDGYHLWSDNFDRELTDVFAIQDEISAAIVKALKVHLDPGHTPASAPRAASLEAYDLYLQGRHQTRLGQPGALERGLELFQKATEVDPEYAPAWAASALAVIHLRESPFWEGVPAEEAVAMAQANIDRALALDPELAEAYVAESVLHWDRYRFDESLASIDRALAINSSLASAHEERATVLASLGRIDEARESLLTASSIDPLDRSILFRAVGLVQDYRDLALLDEVERRARLPHTGEDDYLVELIELIRLRIEETDLAEVYRRYTEAVEAAEVGTPLRRRLEFLRADLGIELNHRPEVLIARARSPELIRFIAVLGIEGQEATAWERYAELPPGLQQVPVVLEEISILHMREGDCEAGLETLAQAHGGRVPIYGQVPPNMPRSNANLAANRVFCLRKLGRDEEAAAILAQLRPFIERLEASAPGGDELLSIKLDVLDGQFDAAMDTLEGAVRGRHLGYWVWVDPMVRSLQGEPGYGPLRQWLEATINAERTTLDWPPVRL